MQLFYLISLSTIGQTFEILDQENQHLVKVLRKNVGDEIFITNGKGQLFAARINAIGKRKSTLEIIKLIKSEETTHNLSIAIAPTKNISRIEWFIEKSVEIGIHEIFLFASQNSERRIVKLDRLQTKAISAMKQSLKTQLPEIVDVQKFAKLIRTISENFDEKYIAYCEENDLRFVENLQINKKTIILIGPEGGFTQEEVNLAKQCGFKTVSLGSSRLRTETAGIFACSVFNELNQS
jgi:16S rRNA (uracil1498-N3)-methyltransferase